MNDALSTGGDYDPRFRSPFDCMDGIDGWDKQRSTARPKSESKKIDGRRHVVLHSKEEETNFVLTSQVNGTFRRDLSHRPSEC